MVIALWVDPAEDDDRVFATAGYWLGTSQAHFAVVGMYVTTDDAGNWRLTGAERLSEEAEAIDQEQEF
jgi:hypothetical protein